MATVGDCNIGGDVMAKTLIFDLETSPNLGYAYGVWDTRLLEIEEYSGLMSFSYKWKGESKIHHVSAVNVARLNYESRGHALAKKLWELFDEADIIMAHNLYGFDEKVANVEFLRHNLGVPSPYKKIDTLRVARRHFKFPGGNSLNALGKYLGVGAKESVGVGALWYDCLKGDKKAWKLLEKYNNQDIVLLEEVYNKMLPFISNHPNIGDIEQVDGICPKCGSDKVAPYGSSKRRNGRVKAYRCGGCGGRCNENTIKPKDKPGRLVNAT